MKKRGGYLIDMKRAMRVKRLRSRIFSYLRIVLIFIIVFSWVFSGYPQFLGIPPSPSMVRAQQLAAPNSDISNAGGWAPTPLYQEINSGSADDNSSVASGNNPATGDTFEVGLETVDDPNTNEGHLIRFRAMKDGGARDAVLRVDLYQGTTLIHQGTFQGPLTDGAFDTYTENISTANADSITDYSNLSIRVIPDQQGGGRPVQSIEVSWLQFEVPSVAAGGPPLVSTNSVFNIDSASAEAEGEVTDDQGGTITGRGFVWGTQSYSDPGNTAPGNTNYDSNIYQAGQFGVGTFTNMLSGLDYATTYYVRAYAGNSEGYSYGEELTFTTSSVSPLVDTLTAINVGQFDAEGRGNVTDTGGEDVTERGLVWSDTSQGDPGNIAPNASNYGNFDSETGTFGTGGFSFVIDSLQQDTTYYYRAYAYNSEGYSYGDEVEFQTLGDMPVVSTNNPTNITQTTVLGHGEVTDQGASAISERGFVWSTTSQGNPGNTTPGSSAYSDSVNETGTFGEGSFSLTLNILNSETTYYYRAYALNTDGYAYGSEVEFTTLDSRPAVSTNAPSSILTRSFEANGSVIDDAGLTVEERGFVWSEVSRGDPGNTAPDNTNYDDFVSESGTFGEGAFSSTVGQLKYNTTYYYRAYAYNSEGYSYGSEVSLTTADAQFARPSADIDTGGWGITPLYSKINSTNRDDSSFIYSDNNTSPDTAGMELSTLEDPSSDTGHFIRYTYRKDQAGGHAINFTIRLLENGAQIAEWTHTNVSADFIYAEQALTAVQAGSINDYTALEIEVVRGGDTGGAVGSRRSARVSWVEFEVPFAPDYDPPTVATNQPSSIDVNEVEGSGSVTNDAGLEITERGFVWSQESQPAPNETTTPGASGYSNSVSESGSFGQGGFTNTLDSLEPNTVYYYRAYALNSEGYGYGGEIAFQTYSETPTVATVGPSNVGADSADATGNIVHGGLSTTTERGFVYGTEALSNPGNTAPDQTGYTDFVSEVGTFTVGQFTLLLDSLNSDTVYYFRAYAKNDQGYSYGELKDFQTHGDLPMVSTAGPSSVQLNQVTGEGEIQQEGLTSITERGFVWSRISQENPGNINPQNEDFPYQYLTNEMGTFSIGTFSLTIDSLREGTVYYYRAYAANGQGYSYGNEVEFSTPSSRPTMLTTTPTDVEYNSALGQGEIVNEGDSAVVERGFVWDIESHTDPDNVGPGTSPYTNNTLQSGTFEVGSYSMMLTGLSDDTTYYYRSVSRNGDGWNYGNEIEFTTPQEPFPPELSNIELNNTTDIFLVEGSTTTVPVSATVTDPNGWEDIEESLLEGVVYRSGVGSSSVADLNNSYPVDNLSLENCEGNSCTVTGSVSMWYFAEPTDDGDYSLEHWEFWLYVEDSYGYSDEGVSQQDPEEGPVDVMTLLAIYVDAGEIDYGVLEIGEDTGSYNIETVVRNTGNSAVTIEVSGENMLLEPGSEIQVNRQQWSANAFSYGAGNELTAITQNTGLSLVKPTSTDPIQNSIFWGIGLPEAVLRGGEYRGLNYFTASVAE